MENSQIFTCILLTTNHMIFFVQFGINQPLFVMSCRYSFYISEINQCTRAIIAGRQTSLSSWFIQFPFKIKIKKKDEVVAFKVKGQERENKNGTETHLVVA